MPHPTTHDWTVGPAKWFAVAVLGAASIFGMTWSITTRQHGTPRATHTAVQAPAPVASQAVPPAAPPAHSPPAAPVGPMGPPGAAGSTAAPAVEEPPPQAPAEPASPAPPPSASRKINLNTATAAELDLLPGIGPALAERIIAERTARGRFAKVDDIDRVRGIGPRTMEKLRPLVTIE